MSGRNFIGVGMAWLLAVLMLLGTFSFYTHPDFMIDMADKLWACF